MKTIKFLKSASPYQTDDVAGFENEVADSYVKAGLAVAWGKKKADEKTAGDVSKVADAPTEPEAAI